MTARRGAVLLEVIVGVAILATAGLAGLALARQSVEAIRVSESREAEVMSASRFLEAVSLWPRSDLDLRLGFRRQGPWFLEIQRVSGMLYFVRLWRTEGDAQLSGSPVLTTALFRVPDPSVPAAGPR